MERRALTSAIAGVESTLPMAPSYERGHRPRARRGAPGRQRSAGLRAAVWIETRRRDDPLADEAHFAVRKANLLATRALGCKRVQVVNDVPPLVFAQQLLE